MEIRPFTFRGGYDSAWAVRVHRCGHGLGFCCGLSFIRMMSCGLWWERSAEVLGVPIDRDGAAEIAMAVAGYAEDCEPAAAEGAGLCAGAGAGRAVDRPTANAALSLLEVDAHGFDELADRRLLRTIIEKYDGGPVGLNTLAAALAEEQDALEEVYEPFLIQIGFLDPDSAGAGVATRLAYEHLGIEMPRKLASLF